MKKSEVMTEQIRPLLKEIHTLARENNINFFALFDLEDQDDNSQTATTLNIQIEDNDVSPMLKAALVGAAMINAEFAEEIFGAPIHV